MCIRRRFVTLVEVYNRMFSSLFKCPHKQGLQIYQNISHYMFDYCTTTYHSFSGWWLEESRIHNTDMMTTMIHKPQ